MDTKREREVKFEVPTGFQLDDTVADLADLHRVETVELNLLSTYFDTADRDLLRHRITLRRREGDDDTGWHLKVPAGIARTEVRLPLAAATDTVPEQLDRLVTGIALGNALTPVATIRTTRRAIRVHDAHNMLVEIADDEVSATDLSDPETPRVWREVEVELGSGDERVLAAIGQRLVDGGASPSSAQSKLARALAFTDVSGTTGAHAVMRGYLHEQLLALGSGDVALRRGRDPVHKTRVAARRFRSVLRVFEPVFNNGNAARLLDEELSWYQDLLGEVRDREVQRARFAKSLQALPDEFVLGPVAAHIDEMLLSEQVVLRAELMTALDSDRYRRLLRDVTRWAEDPPLRTETHERDLGRLARDARHTAAKRLRKAIKRDDPELLHRARKATKRARYATELTQPLKPQKAKQQVKEYKRAQDVLGDHQDCVVAAEFLRRAGIAAGSNPQVGGNGFTYGLLYQRELERARDLRRRARGLHL